MTQVKLTTLYQQAIDSGTITPDQGQLNAVEYLQAVFEAVQTPTKSTWFGLGKKQPETGAYLYGSVGTGKTFLLDLFFQNLPIEKKMRRHFYRFMAMVHERLKPLQGEKDPLKLVAKELAASARIICFDEFFVTNIVDAMLLGNLLSALYEEGITLVATSNVPPEELYKDGLQRQQFLPAIELLEQYNHVIQVDSGVDYRLDKADYDRAYFYPQDPDMQDLLLSRFKELSTGEIQYNTTITIDKRGIPVLYQSDNAIWFGFEVLCGIPRSQTDYLELSERFDYVFVSGLRPIKRHENDLISNFIKLIDVFYDVSTKLVIMASVPINEIYPTGEHGFEFQRTQSRLYEMQSEDYLSKT